MSPVNKARHLREIAEPIAASIYFAPEAAEEYSKLGLSFLPGYFCSRSAPLGKAPGPVVAAVFAAFNPAIVLPSVADGWSKTSPEEIIAARLTAATRMLKRILGEEAEGVALEVASLVRPAAESIAFEGKPLFAGLVSLPWPTEPLAQLFRACDLIREHRGDCHILAWASKGLTGLEVTLLSEGWWGIKHGSYVKTRGFSDDDIKKGVASLSKRGLMKEGGEVTEEGLKLREKIEEETDALAAPIVEALGEEGYERLEKLLSPLAQKMISAGAYSPNPGELTRLLRGGR